MTTWKYIGCNMKDMPKNILEDKKMSRHEIKEIIDSVPLVEGEIIAATVDAVVSLLLHDSIFPLKLHPLNSSENKVKTWMELRDKLKKKR